MRPLLWVAGLAYVGGVGWLLGAAWAAGRRERRLRRQRARVLCGVQHARVRLSVMREYPRASVRLVEEEVRHYLSELDAEMESRIA